MSEAPLVEGTGHGRCRVTGTFHRGVDPAFREHALAGSRAAGRYSSVDQPTLYLSSSPEGVAAAMIAHAATRAPDRAVLRIAVEADGVVDLRDADACRAIGIVPADAAAPWQDVVPGGGEPPSWRVRRRLEEVGAAGLIDPSRQRPGLWHLVLFRWNEPGAPTARVSPAGRTGSG